MNFFLRSRDSYLRVLMYHKIAAGAESDFLTVPAAHLEAQFQYLRGEGYTPLLLSDLVSYVKERKALPPKPLLITFDDGYRNNFTVMYPLLKKYGMKANIFLVPGFLQGDSRPDNEPYLRMEDIQAMDPSLVEFGLHSLDHKSYKTLSAKEIDDDIMQTKKMLRVMGIRFQPCLAYPYGAYPKRNLIKLHELFETLKINNVVLAFRIGNRLNRLPFQNPLLIQRLDIRGDAPFTKFVQQVKKGKSLI